MINLIYPFDGFIQKRRYFTASTMELRLFGFKPSSLFVSESTIESMVLSHVLETAVTMVIAIRYTRSTTYKPETYPNLRSIPSEAWPGDNFVQIFNIPISHIPVDAFISYSNLEWIHLDNLGLHYIEEGAFRGQDKLHYLYIHNAGVALQLPSNLGPPTKSLVTLMLWNTLPRRKAMIYPYFAAFEKLEFLNIGGGYTETFEAHLLPRNLTNFFGQTLVLPTFPSIGNYAPLLQQISLESCEMNTMPVRNMSGLTNVKILSLRNNALSLLPDISFMKVLETLILHRNRLASMPDLYELPLTTLTLNENPLMCDKALCWIRMWPWMRNSTIPSDEPTCVGPIPIGGMKLMGVDPTLMECFGGEFLHSTQLPSCASYQIRKRLGCACAGNAGSVFPTTNSKACRDG